MSSEVVERVHPVVDFAHRLSARVEDLASVAVWSMTPAEQRAALAELAVGEAKLAALRVRLLAEADRSGATDTECSGTAADWLAVETHQTHRAVRADLRLGLKLDAYPLLGAACDRGEVNPAQARVIVTALDRLPTTGPYALSAEEIGLAEAHLVSRAAEFDADGLKRLGMRIFEVIAPDLAEAWEGKTLEAQEARALRRTELQLWDDGEGICHGRFRIPHLHGQMLGTMLAAFTNPAHPDNRTGSEDGEGSESKGPSIDPDLPVEVKRGLAFTQLLEAIGGSDLPRNGGVGAAVVVTMTLEQLLADLETAGVCTLDTGGRISAAEARRLACAAGIIPMVLDGASQVLDVGRKRRLHTESMRVAMGVRDGGCTAEGCTTPPGMCHAHHDTPWSAGGTTSVSNGRLLCPHHHRRVHDPRTRVERLSTGQIRFHRRT